MRTIIDDLYEIVIDDTVAGSRMVAVWGDDVSQDTTMRVPTLIMSMTHDGYNRMKADLQEYHNMLRWMDANPRCQMEYNHSETIRYLKL